jgi:hypothetical protein
MVSYEDLLEQISGLRTLVGTSIEGCTAEDEYTMLNTVEDLLMVSEQTLTNYLLKKREELTS